MLRQQAYKYELRENGEQRRKMRRFAGSRRFVMNKALALQKENYEAGGKYIRYEEMAKNLSIWRAAADTSWLKESPFHTLQQALKDLDNSYQNFFAGRADFPKFKKKGRGDSFRFPDAKQLKFDQVNGRISVPKLGWIRYHNSRDAMGVLRNVTISACGGKWFASIQTQREVNDPLTSSTTSIGVDVGITRFATLSNGAFFAPLNSFKAHQKKLAKYQRAMSRKVKFSSNWKKAKAKITKLHIGIGNARKDYLHKATATISKNHALVAIEDLKVSNMSKSASGTLAEPGRNVRAKSGLNRSILDQGWGEFRRQLGYKVDWQGGWLIAVPPQYTSQTCPCCGHVSKENRKTQALFLCVECHYENNADVVGAINIENRALKMLSFEGQDTA